MTFFPPNVTEATGRRGKEYYDRIRDVIDRVLSKSNEEESKIAFNFLAEIGEDEKPDSLNSRPRRATARPGRPPSRPSLSGGIVDLSWKDGGTTYPKRSSQVGDEYQATQIPAAGSSKGVEKDD